MKVFLCYDHKDKTYADELKKHLRTLEIRWNIQTSYYEDILPGNNQEQAIREQWETADIILLLMSVDFITSKYYSSKSMFEAIERQKAGKVHIIPIILRAIVWQDTHFKELRTLPSNNEPITAWKDQDGAFSDIVQGISKVINEIQRQTLNETDLSEKQIHEYNLIASVGSGTHGVVYKAYKTGFPQEVFAVKVMHSMHLNNIERKREFSNEIEIYRMLQHPSILSIKDDGIFQGVPYLVTEYAAGGSLRDRLNHQPGRPLPIQDALKILVQIGKALDYIHQQKVLHLDLKPENILFNSRGDVLLADFHIATLNLTMGTQSITSIGTPTYTAPEEFENKASTLSDQYSLGCIAYELFTGSPPFQAHKNSLFALINMHQNIPPASLIQHNPQLPMHIEKAVLKALAKNRNDRFKTVGNLIEALVLSASNHSNTAQYTIATAIEKVETNNQVGQSEKSETLVPSTSALSLDTPFQPGLVNASKKKSNKKKLESLREQGNDLYKQGKYTEALKAFESALRFAPHDTQLHYQKALILRDLKSYDEVLSTYEQIINLDVNQVNAYEGQVEVFQEIGLYDAALTAYNHVLRLALEDVFVEEFIAKHQQDFPDIDQEEDDIMPPKGTFDTDKLIELILSSLISSLCTGKKVSIKKSEVEILVERQIREIFVKQDGQHIQRFSQVISKEIWIVIERLPGLKLIDNQIRLTHSPKNAEQEIRIQIAKIQEIILLRREELQNPQNEEESLEETTPLKSGNNFTYNPPVWQPINPPRVEISWDQELKNLEQRIHDHRSGRNTYNE